ncbi:hypothetical protein EDB80DRAFT_107347 [Ilyonectria destructans]|nr:hypothetical protein EDB80DRAFT_107347 [Ilyonectria destructans]
MSVTCTVANQFHFVYRTTTVTPRRSDASTRRLTICRRSRGAPIPGGCSPNGHGLGGKPGQQNTVREAGGKRKRSSLINTVLGWRRGGYHSPTGHQTNLGFFLAHRIASVLDPSQRDRPQCSSLLHNRMEPLQTAPRVGLDFCAPRACKPVEIRAHVEYPLMRVHADSSPSGGPVALALFNISRKCDSPCNIHCGRVIKGHPQPPTGLLRWSASRGGPSAHSFAAIIHGRQSSCNAVLCHTHDELQPPTIGQDDLSVRLPGGWHGFSFPSWLPCRAPSSLSMKPHSRPNNPLHPPITLK